MDTHHKNQLSSSQHRPHWSDRGEHKRQSPHTLAPGGNCPAGRWHKRWLERGPCGTQQTVLRGGPGSGSCWWQDTALREWAGMSYPAAALSSPGQVSSSLWWPCHPSAWSHWPHSHHRSLGRPGKTRLVAVGANTLMSQTWSISNPIPCHQHLNLATRPKNTCKHPKSWE